MNSPLDYQDDSEADPNPPHANDRSLNEPNASEWMSDDDTSPEGHQGRTDAGEQAASEKQNLIPKSVLGWTLLLVVVAILGNLALPIALDRLFDRQYITPPRPFPQGSVIEWIRYYQIFFRAAFVGLWFAEYVALWLWINSYIRSKATRWLLGVFLCEAISYTAVLGMATARGPAPTDFFWFCMIGSLGLYATIHILLKLLLRRSDFDWQPLQLGTGSRYSIRALLGTMIGSAVLMLGLRLFPYNSTELRAKTVLDFAPATIWLAWLAIAIAPLIWLQLGSIFSSRRGRFVLCFLALAIFGPIVFHLIGAGLLAWNPETRFTIYFDQVLIVYSVEVGLVAGVSLMIPLLPRRAVDGSEQKVEGHVPN